MCLLLGGRPAKLVTSAPTEVQPFVEEGLVNALGGCCGSRPEHIAAIVKMASP